MARVMVFDPEAEILVEDWCDNFDDDYSATNLMWEMDGPADFNPTEWLFTLFSQRYKKAMSDAEAFHLQVIRGQAFAGVWQASAWWLERRMPEEYGRKDSMAVQGVEGGVPITMQATSVEQLMNSIRELQEARKAIEQ